MVRAAEIELAARIHADAWDGAMELAKELLAESGHADAADALAKAAARDSIRELAGYTGANIIRRALESARAAEDEEAARIDAVLASGWLYLPPAVPAAPLLDYIEKGESGGYEVRRKRNPRKLAIDRPKAIRNHFDELAARQRVNGVIVCTGCGRADNHPHYWDVDHILTFVGDDRKTWTRDNTVANLQLLCRPCNILKHGDKTMLDLWAANVHSGFGPGDRKAARDKAWWQVKEAIKRINPNSGLE